MACNPTVGDVDTNIANRRLEQPTQIVIPFQSLLLQINKHLHFPVPKYEVVDVKTNSAVVLVYTDCGPEAYTFVGGPCTNLEKSCQKAAQIAVSDIMVRFSVWVEDISISKRREIERCATLYRLKRQEIRYLKRGLVGVPLIEKLGRGAPIGTVPVIVDFTAILHLIIKKCDIESSDLETVAHGRSKYTAWVTITYPNASYGRKTFYSLCCDYIEDAKNSLAKTVIEYLIPIYNLEIIDANYNPKLTAYAMLLCALEMESYLCSKERFLEMDVVTDIPRMLPVKSGSKTVDTEIKIPTMISRPLPPQKRPFKNASMLTSLKNRMQNAKKKNFKIPAELPKVWKRLKYSNTAK